MAALLNIDINQFNQKVDEIFHSDEFNMRKIHWNQGIENIDIFSELPNFQEVISASVNKKRAAINRAIHYYKMK